MAPVVTQPPMPRKKFSRLRRKRPRSGGKLPGWTSNPLIIGLITVILSGVLSYLVAHQQSQDATRQAVTDQQVQAVIQLETDAKALYVYADRTYIARRECVDAGVSAACKQVETSISDSPFIGYDTTLGADLANVSDAFVRKYAGNFEDDALAAAADAGSSQGYDEWANMSDVYSDLLTRCGQIIQGQT